MSLIDWMLLLAVLVVAGWRLIAPAGKWLLPALGVVLALAAVQVLAEEFYWLFLPLYVLIVILALSAVKLRSPSPTWLAWLGRAGLASVTAFAIAPLAVWTPVPELPAPSGPFPVGTEIYRWVDAARDETATESPSDKRNVIAQAWYPALENRGQRSPYMEGLDALPPFDLPLPGLIMRSHDRIDTHATLDADISGEKLWPVIVFSPGFGAPRAYYTGPAAELASRGYVVVMLDHPYEAPVTQLADGNIAKKIDTSPYEDGARDAWMAEQLDIRVRDFQFVLDRLAEGIGRVKGHIDPSRIVAMGHSFGGATAIAAAGRDTRIAAVANIDGTPYGALPVIHRPFLLLQSDFTVTGHGDSFLHRNRQLLEQATAPAWRYEILHANHFDFLDAPLYIAPPGQLALSLVAGGELFGGGRGPMETQHAAADILDAFIRETLSGESGLLKETVARYRDIGGGQVQENSTSVP
jgi:predicted dienelactone hydrolase